MNNINMLNVCIHLISTLPIPINKYSNNPLNTNNSMKFIS